MNNILYFVWVSYTVGSLSVIFGLVSLAVLAYIDQKRHDKRIRKLLKARPEDE